MDLEFFHGRIALVFCKLRVGRVVYNLHLIEFLRPKVLIITGSDYDLQLGRGLGIVEVCASVFITIAAEVVPRLSAVVEHIVVYSACTVRVGLGWIEGDCLDTLVTIQ